MVLGQAISLIRVFIFYFFCTFEDLCLKENVGRYLSYIILEKL